jgi:nucleotide-binding universal stress UspA family protein
MYKRIFVAIDSSSTAQKALNEAIDLAVKLEAALCIGTALDEAPLSQHGLGLGTYIDLEKVKQEMRDVGNALLEKAVAQAKAAGCDPYSILIESEQKRLSDMIIDAAAQWNADLIVMGTHGRRGFERMLVGSVAEHVIRAANTTLMLVRKG